nr:deoxyribonuclease V [Desulfobacterales bacterium]
MKVHLIHQWDVSSKEAIALQISISKQISLRPIPKRITTVAGADVSYSRKGRELYAAALVFTFPDLVLLEMETALGTIDFPYIPGLLSFREGPVLLSALEKIQNRPDVIIFDGHGIAHPRRAGLASHLGMILKCPTIGCAKTRFVGEHRAVPPQKGSIQPIKYQGQVVGAAVRTRERVKPVYVSPGYAVTLNASIDIVLACCRKYRLPEPVRQAHIVANRLRLN